MRWALGLHDLASVAVGVMILAWPGISVYALTIVFGVYTLAASAKCGGSCRGRRRASRATRLSWGAFWT
jgi:uncharacterized membrane protein HdeD (DUF308 family)